MTKKTVNGNLVFTANVPTYLPPVIKDEFVNDDGELVYVLANGNTSLADKYNSIWRPIRGVINMQGRGETIESKQRKY